MEEIKLAKGSDVKAAILDSLKFAKLNETAELLKNDINVETVGGLLTVSLSEENADYMKGIAAGFRCGLDHFVSEQISTGLGGLHNCDTATTAINFSVEKANTLTFDLSNPTLKRFLNEYSTPVEDGVFEFSPHRNILGAMLREILPLLKDDELSKAFAEDAPERQEIVEWGLGKLLYDQGVERNHNINVELASNNDSHQSSEESTSQGLKITIDMPQTGVSRVFRKGGAETVALIKMKAAIDNVLTVLCTKASGASHREQLDVEKRVKASVSIDGDAIYLTKGASEMLSRELETQACRPDSEVQDSFNRGYSNKELGCLIA